MVSRPGRVGRISIANPCSKFRTVLRMAGHSDISPEMAFDSLSIFASGQWSPSKRVSERFPKASRAAGEGAEPRTRCRVRRTSGANADCVWTDMPPELMGLVVGHLSGDEIQMARLVCRDWRRIISASVASLKPHYFDGTNSYHDIFISITQLDLRNCASMLDDRALVCALQPFNRLHRLDLSGCSNLTDESIIMLFDRDTAPLRRSLTWLSLQNVANLTDDAVYALCGISKRLPSLPGGCGRSSAIEMSPLSLGRRVHPIFPPHAPGGRSGMATGCGFAEHGAAVASTCVGPAGLHKGALLAGQSVGRGAIRLEYLDLSGCILLTDCSMGAIRRCLPNLRDLRLGGYSRTSAVGDSMLVHLASSEVRPKDPSCSETRRVPSNLRHLDLSGCITVTTSGLRPVLMHTPNLDRLNLWNCMSIRSDSLGVLSRPSSRPGACLGLRELNLRGCHGIDDDVFQHIAALPKLEVLDMRSCEQLSGRSIGLLRGTRLRHLNMKSCFGLNDLTGIARISSLEVLNLGDCWQIHIEELEYLSSLSNLLELDLSGCRNICNRPGRGVPALSHMKRLVSLCLHQCERLCEGALSSLAGHPRLQSLDVSRCSSLPSSDLKYLWDLPSLRRIKASHCPWSGCSALRSIGPINSLEELRLQGCLHLVGTSFESLKRLKNLRLLVLDGCSNTPLFDRGLASISSSLRSLKELSLQSCVTIGDSGIASMGELRNLEVVNLSDCYGITGEGFRSWKHMHSLRIVNLQGCSGITDKGVEELVASNGSIVELNLKQCRRITDKAIISIVDHLPRIKSLALQASMGITDHGVTLLAERASQIQYLAIQFCWQFGDISAVKLAEMPWLKHLDLLYSWKITDASVNALAASTSLVELNIFGCHRVSYQARQRLASKLSPMCRR